MMKNQILCVLFSQILMLAMYSVANDTAPNVSLLGAGNVVSLDAVTYQLRGESRVPGDAFPQITLTGEDGQVQTNALVGNIHIYVIIPKLGTSVCDQQVKDLSRLAEASIPQGINLLVISRDSVNEQKAFKQAHNISERITFLSDTTKAFGSETGTEIEQLGLLARTLIVTDEANRIIYVDRYEDLTQVPDFNKALEAALTVK